jgi:hypothetical protein
MHNQATHHLASQGCCANSTPESPPKKAAGTLKSSGKAEKPACVLRKGTGPQITPLEQLEQSMRDVNCCNAT